MGGVLINDDVLGEEFVIFGGLFVVLLGVLRLLGNLEILRKHDILKLKYGLRKMRKQRFE